MLSLSNRQGRFSKRADRATCPGRHFLGRLGGGKLPDFAAPFFGGSTHRVNTKMQIRSTADECVFWPYFSEFILGPQPLYGLVMRPTFGFVSCCQHLNTTSIDFPGVKITLETWGRRPSGAPTGHPQPYIRDAP